MVYRFVSLVPSVRTNNYPESGCGLGHVTLTIFGSMVGYPSDSLASCLEIEVKLEVKHAHRISSLRPTVGGLVILLVCERTQHTAALSFPGTVSSTSTDLRSCHRCSGCYVICAYFLQSYISMAFRFRDGQTDMCHILYGLQCLLPTYRNRQFLTTQQHNFLV